MEIYEKTFSYQKVTDVTEILPDKPLKHQL